jgi:hypothetical protein
MTTATVEVEMFDGRHEVTLHVRDARAEGSVDCVFSVN